MPRPRLARLTVAVVLAACCGWSAGQASSLAEAPPPRRDIALPRDSVTTDARVPPNATLAALLQRHSLPVALANALVRAIAGVFDVRTLRAGQSYRLTQSIDGAFREFQYDIDAARYVRVSNAAGTSPSPALSAEVVTYPRDVTEGAVSAAITRDRSSLIGAINAAGEGVTLALLVAEVFGGEVDFNSDLQPGDRVDTLFERVSRNGVSQGYGDLEAAELTNGGRKLTAIRFAGPGGRSGWYDERGQSLKRQFLRSPLSLDPEPRVTSRFSYHRENPVSGAVRPHLGVDYHADYGAPVVAVGDGVIEMAGWNGDAGRMVEIRHAGGYQTAYLHLSAFAAGVRAGSRVVQGQLIGRVGDSGAVTGPHLDYRVKKNGTYVNPLAELSRMPRGEAIPASAADTFAAVRDAALSRLRSLAAPAASADRKSPR